MRITGKKEIVKAALTKFPTTRDSDFMLIATIWWQELPEEAKQNKAVKAFFVRLSNGDFSNPESIRRARQLIQAQDETLRGESYKYKVNKEEKLVRDEIMNDSRQYP